MNLLDRRREMTVIKVNGQPNNEVWYVTSDGLIATITEPSNMVSHTYSDGKGVIRCSADITTTPNKFFQSTNIQKIFLPKSVTEVGATLSSANSEILLIDFGENVTTINIRPIWYPLHSGQVEYVVRAVTPPSISGLAGTAGWIKAVYVPDDSVDTYKADSGWSPYSAKIKPLSDYE